MPSFGPKTGSPNFSMNNALQDRNLDNSKVLHEATVEVTSFDSDVKVDVLINDVCADSSLSDVQGPDKAQGILASFTSTILKIDLKDKDFQIGSETSLTLARKVIRTQGAPRHFFWCDVGRSC